MAAVLYGCEGQSAVTPISGKGWLHTFARAVSSEDLEAALHAIDQTATSHAGTAPAAEKRAAVQEVLSRLSEERLPEAALWFASRDSATAKELGALLLAQSYPQHPVRALAGLRRLADDPNWEVREWAGSALGQVFARDFDTVLPEMRDWLRDESQFVRRAVCLAIMGAADSGDPKQAEPLLALADELARDRAEEVRRNTGPFAVGGRLLARYPEPTLAHVRRWASSDDEMLRWNAAMVFVAANSRHHVEAGLEILSGLALDRRRSVWMAVASALKHLLKREPARVEKELRVWLSDDRKLPASIALRTVSLNEKAR
jgi:hypothetical protein